MGSGEHELTSKGGGGGEELVNMPRPARPRPSLGTLPAETRSGVAGEEATGVRRQQRHQRKLICSASPDLSLVGHQAQNATLAVKGVCLHIQRATPPPTSTSLSQFLTPFESSHLLHLHPDHRIPA